MNNGEATPPASRPPSQKDLYNLEKHDGRQSSGETVTAQDHDAYAEAGEKSGQHGRRGDEEDIANTSPGDGFTLDEENRGDDNAGDDLNELAAIESTQSISAGLSPIHEVFFVIILVCAQLFTQVGLVQCLILTREIAKSFNVTSPALESWFIAGYSLTVGTFILFSGRLGDMFGYKPVLVIGYAWFSLWSVIVGLSVYSNHVLFVWARVLSGIGPALCLPNALAILGATYPPGMKKNFLFSLFGAAAPEVSPYDDESKNKTKIPLTCGRSDGAVFGVALAAVFNLAWWPWAFWATALILACLSVAAYFVLPDVPRRRSAECNTLRALFFDMDIPGTVVGVAGLVLFNFAWNQAPLVGWDKAYVIVSLVLGALFIGAFFLVEIRFAKAPLIPFEALTSDASFVLAMVACGWGCFGIWVYYLFQTLQVLQGASPLLTVAKLAPVVVSGSTAAITTGFLLHRLGPAVVMCMALVAFTLGAILVATVPIGQTYWGQLFVATLVTPFGMDMSFPAATLILSNLVAREHQGVAASLVNTVVNYSISMSLGIVGTIEIHVNNGGLTLQDQQKGFRGALYFGIGLAGLGLGIGIVFLSKSMWRKRSQTRGNRNGSLESANPS